jgi:hypothetical protein
MGCRLAAINHNTLALEPLVLCVLWLLRSSRRRRRKQSLFYVPTRATALVATLIHANGRQSAPKSTGVLRASRKLVSECECLLLHALSDHTCAASERRPEVPRQATLFTFLQLAFLFSRWDFTSTAFMALGNSLMRQYGVKKDAQTHILRLADSQVYTFLGLFDFHFINIKSNVFVFKLILVNTTKIHKNNMRLLDYI